MTVWYRYLFFCLSLCLPFCLSLPLPQASAQALDSYKRKESMDLHDHQIKTNELKLRNHKGTNKPENRPDPCLVSLYEFCTSCVLNPLRKKGWEQFLFYFQFCSSRRSERKIAATISVWSKTQSATDVSESLWQTESLAIELQSMELQSIWNRWFRVHFHKAFNKQQRKEKGTEKKRKL